MLMRRDVLSVRARDTVDHLMEWIPKAGTEWVPVVDDAGAAIGMISLDDVVQADVGEYVHERMRTDVATVREDDSLDVAAQTIARSHLNHLVVVNSSGDRRVGGRQ
jgi:predicted transcriptional regulator